MDATVVVQVFVEGTKAAVEAATSPQTKKADSEDEEVEEVDEEPLADSKPAAAGKKKGKDKEAAAKPKKRKEKKAPGFEHVVLGVAVGEAFPDDILK